MGELCCAHCNSSQIQVKEIEFRHINLKNMKQSSREMALEIFCLSCEYLEIKNRELTLV